MEDEFKILMVEYLSHYWSNLILNLSLGEQTKTIPLNDDLNIYKVKYLNDHRLDHTQS